MGQTRTTGSIRFAVAALLLTAFSMAFTFGGASSAAGVNKNAAAKALQTESPQAGVIIYALNELNNHLVSFDSTAPGTLLSDVAITGLQSGEFLSGIDFRPATGKLYTVGSSNRIYIINPSSGVATAVNATPFTPGIGIDTDYAGFDFNPSADRIRIVTTGGANIRINPDTGQTVGTDSTPTFAPGDVNASTTAALSQLAYSNNIAGATPTTAYAIDFQTDSLVTLGSINGTPDSPNSGIVHTIGALGVTTTSESGGFDIQAGSGTGFASLRTSPDGSTFASNLYTVNLTTGVATSIGRIGSAANNIRVDGLAVAGAATPTRTQYDFDGDRRADASVFRSSVDPNNNFWYILNSATNTFTSQEWGQQGDKLAPADYDGDTKTDIAIWRDNGTDPNLAYFFILNSNGNTVRVEQLGSLGDVLTVGDWDGDGKADPAVYRAGASAGAQSYFFYMPSTTPGVKFNTIPWGTNGDTSVRGDFDGDGKFDAAVFRPSTQTWYISNSSNGAFRSVIFGAATDRPVMGDFDADGKTDIATFRDSNNSWNILQSSNSAVRFETFGSAGDTLVPADYDGDGRTELAIWRNGLYIIQQATGGVSYIQWGAAGDIPVASAYNR